MFQVLTVQRVWIFSSLLSGTSLLLYVSWVLSLSSKINTEDVWCSHVYTFPHHLLQFDKDLDFAKLLHKNSIERDKQYPVHYNCHNVQYILTSVILCCCAAWQDCIYLSWSVKLGPCRDWKTDALHCSSWCPWGQYTPVHSACILHQSVHADPLSTTMLKPPVGFTVVADQWKYTPALQDNNGDVRWCSKQYYLDLWYHFKGFLFSL